VKDLVPSQASARTPFARAYLYFGSFIFRAAHWWERERKTLAADSRCELSAPILERREIYAHTLSGSLLHTRSVCGRRVVLGRAGALGPVVINSVEM
jgi:hypothetical protein